MINLEIVKKLISELKHIIVEKHGCEHEIHLEYCKGNNHDNALTYTVKFYYEYDSKTEYDESGCPYGVGQGFKVEMTEITEENADGNKVTLKHGMEELEGVICDKLCV